MNGSGENRYSADFEKISKKLRLLYPCACCGENDFGKKEVHHIDENKKNSNLDNLIVLCQDCHFLYHQGKQTLPEVNYNFPMRKINIEIESIENWINKDSKIQLIVIDSKTAMDFRRLNVKGWVKTGSCNLYLGMIVDNILRGVLGFQNQDFGNYGMLMKADTTNSNDKYSIDLLLYLMRTKECKHFLERKFNRTIDTVYSMCFSSHQDISRYRKHGNLFKKIPTDGGFNISYEFITASIPSVKSAKAEFFQKHKDI